MDNSSLEGGKRQDTGDNSANNDQIDDGDIEGPD